MQTQWGHLGCSDFVWTIGAILKACAGRGDNMRLTQQRAVLVAQG